MPWTINQQRSIDERDKNLLVSAAAGSGKTAVLVERIIKLILEDGVDIDRFLVVTFTRAAASEMKEKLVQAIREQILKEEDQTKRLALKRQLDRMYLANISTFHSFAIGILRRFFQYVDLDPSVRVMDEAEADILLSNAIDDVFASMFAEEDPAFLRFLDRHSRHVSDETLKKALLADYRTMRSIPHYFDWLDKSLERLSMPLAQALQGEALEWMRRDYVSHLENACEKLSEEADLFGRSGVPAFEAKVRKHRETILSLIDTCASSDDFRSCIDAIPSVSFTQKELGKNQDEVDAFRAVKKDAAAIHKEAKEEISALKKKYLANTDEQEQFMMQQTAEDGQCYREILHKLEETYRAEKRERLVIDYSDIEHYAIDILQHEDAAAIYREQFKYIFIDEYQDSNYLQETIISAIAREDDLFMVGDVKQSIYRFRLADPDLFLEKYQRYAVSEGPDEKIDLNHNFRSKRPVIETVNHLFSSLMDGYDEAAALRQGAPSEKDIEYPTEMVLIDRTAGQQPADPEDAVDEELQDMKWQEKEAMAVCRLIKESLGKPFYDTKNDQVRGFALRDMVILMRSIKQAGPIYKDVFRREGIGVFVEDTSSFFETLEIQTVLDLLRLLDNPQRDLALLGVLRSFFFDFTIDELIRIRLSDKTVPFYQAFADFGTEGTDDLAAKCREAAAGIAKWRHLASYLPLDELIGRLLHDSGYYACMGAVPGGQQRQANLKTLADKARGLMEMGRNRIQDLLRYVEALQQRGDVHVGQTSLLGEKDDVVRIMTIHKSKGLEFPLVFVSGLGAGKGHGNSTGFAAIDRGMGIALPFSDSEKRYHQTVLLDTLISEKHKAQEAEEDIRVLYVALTRARDKLVMTAAIDPEKESKSYYYHMIAPLLSDDCPVMTRWVDPFEGYVRTEEQEKRIDLKTLLDGYLKVRNPALRDEVKRRLGAVYPYTEDMDVKSKYSVTELNHPADHTAPVLRLPDFLKEDLEKEPKSKSIHGAALGTVLHTAMEHLPLRLLCSEPEGVSEDAVCRYLDDLEEREILTAAERAAIDPEMLTGFADSTLGRRIAASEEVHRETPFTYTYHLDGRDVLVQGIVDCWFVEEDGNIVLVDYKSNMHTEEIRALYQMQLDLYKEALEGLTGKKVKESYLYLLREKRLVDML